MSEEEIMKNWGEYSDPLVSICCITYNHENYIADTLESFLGQNTIFPFEVLIHDDASTDSTASIIKKYVKKYPKIIKPIYQVENQRSKFKSGMNPRFNFPRVQGKYIALCEGDDYWTDPFKLQKQVDFLEANPDYVLIHTAAGYKDEETNLFIEKFQKNDLPVYKQTENCAPLILTDSYGIITCTMLIKSDLVHQILDLYPNDFTGDYMMGDNQLQFHLARLGKFAYLDEATAVYRRHSGGATALYNLKQRFIFIKNVYYQRKSFAERYNYWEIIPEIDSKYLRSLFLLASKLRYKNEMQFYFQNLATNPLITKFDLQRFSLKMFLYNKVPFGYTIDKTLDILIKTVNYIKRKFKNILN